jgi:hypothetical protein
LVPHTGQDLSAYRYDGEVFGWNKTFTEVAAVASEVTRGPQGRHRGEVFMLAFKLGDTRPLHNINCHIVTHADFPDDPVPLSDVRDMMWVLENPLWLDTWPVRPKHKRPKHGMQVEPVWDPMDPNTQALTTLGPQGQEEAPRATDQALCTPGLGFVLRWHGQRRFVPHVAVDLKARCDLIRLTDNRIYWGRDDVAADMARFDFSPRHDNEESGRFIVSAAWRLGRTVHFQVHTRGPLGAKQMRQVRTLAGQYGAVGFAPSGSSRGVQGLREVRAAPALLALGRRVAAALAGPTGAMAPVRAEPGAGDTVTLQFGPPLPSAPQGQTPATSSTQAAAGAPGATQQAPAAARSSPHDAPQTNPRGVQRAPGYVVFGAELPEKLIDAPTTTLQDANASEASPKPHSRPAPTSPSYLDDWQLP